MWDFLMRQIPRQALKQAGKQAISSLVPKQAFSLIPEPMNESEAYVDRMKRDFHIDDYYDALELYNSDPAYWQQYYQPLPSPDPSRERIRDSIAMAAILSRSNVFE